jgi:hypothetical protein
VKISSLCSAIRLGLGFHTSEEGVKWEYPYYTTQTPKLHQFGACIQLRPLGGQNAEEVQDFNLYLVPVERVDYPQHVPVINPPAPRPLAHTLWPTQADVVVALSALVAATAPDYNPAVYDFRVYPRFRQTIGRGKLPPQPSYCHPQGPSLTRPGVYRPRHGGPRRVSG